MNHPNRNWRRHMQQAAAPDSMRSSLSYDPNTGSFVWVVPPRTWPSLRGKPAGGPHLSRRGKRYWEIKFRGVTYRRGRLAFLFMTSRWPHEVDHINGNSLDDRWENLREATRLTNSQNVKKREKKSGLPLGVTRNRAGFRAQIKVYGKRIALGTYQTVEEAASVYRDARSRYFGAFA